VEARLLSTGLARPGDQVAITFGMDVCTPPGSTAMKLWTVTDGN
jgi:hypothetical protein